MRIEGIIWLRQIVDKLALKHKVDVNEVEETLNNKPKIRFVEKGLRKNENIYMALGQTDSGQYLSILFIYKLSKQAVVLSARDMARKERNIYGKK